MGGGGRNAPNTGADGRQQQLQDASHLDKNEDVLDDADEALHRIQYC